MSDASNQRLLRAKVVMLGAPGVGKTSLVRRFVHSVFTDSYRSTLGVHVDRKSVSLDDAVVSMVLWDVHGEGDGLTVTSTYLRGIHAALLVYDASRPETIATTALLHQRLLEFSPNAEVIAVANKSDLPNDDVALASQLSTHGVAHPRATSAKTGDGVEEAFNAVAELVVRRQG